MKLGAGMPPKNKLTKREVIEMLEHADLSQYRPAVICPYCWELNDEDNIAVPIGETTYEYSCYDCGLLIKLQ